MAVIKQAILDVLSASNPATVRQTYYQLVSRGVIAKTETEYKSTVVRLLTEMRRDRTIPYGWIADNTRWMRKPRTYSSLEDMLALTAETYRRALWDTQDVYVEVWLEKDALAGVVMEETAEWDVPLMVTRGYSSLSFLASAAETIAEQLRPTFIYYLGDHDPSGLDIPRAVERELRRLAPGAEIHFERIAVTEEQIERLNLPTRPTKRSDSRAQRFRGESVEVDAIPPTVLRGLVRDSIVQHVDTAQLGRLELVEDAERETLDRIVLSLTAGER
jgi:hypothetical protein